MQISSILDITNGELQNSPLISFITDIKINPNKVKQGDLFLVNNPDDIALAIQNGAFAIIYDNKNIPIIDKEIAWILVEDTSYAMIRLMRYILSLHNIEVYLCDDITIDLIKLYTYDFKHPVIILEDNMYENIIKLNQIEEFSIIFTSDKKYLEKIFPQYKNFNNKYYEILNQTIHSAFETTFSYEDKYFSRLKLPQIYINQFLDIYLYLDKQIDLNKLKLSILSKPIFINLHCDIIEFGKSDKFILPIKNKNIAKNQIEFIKHIYKYANINIIDYNDKDLIKIIKTTNFNILIVVEGSYEDMVEILSQPKEEQTLF